MGWMKKSDVSIPELMNEIPAMSEDEKDTVQARHEAAKEAAEAWLTDNINHIERVICESEDGEVSCTIMELQDAIKYARTSDLERFIQTGQIWSEGEGVLSVKLK